jgi:hypothetical protein
MMKKIFMYGILPILLIAASVAASFTTVPATQAVPKQNLDEAVFNAVPKKNLDEILFNTGAYVASHRELFTDVLAALELKRELIEPKDVVTRIGNIPITIQEIKLRQNFRQIAEADGCDNKSIFNQLVEEKLIMNYAFENNLLATEEEVQAYINQDKSLYYEYEEAKSTVDAYCAGAQIDLEEYWNTCSRYFALRLATLGKTSDYVIEQAIRNWEITLPAANPTSRPDYSYWVDFVKNLKSKVSITISPSYRGERYELDRSTMYNYEEADRQSDHGDSEQHDSELRYTETVGEFLVAFGENKDLGAEHDINKLLAPDVALFLKGKIEVAQYVAKLYYHTEKANGRVTAILLEEQPLDADNVYLRFQVITTFNHVDMLGADSMLGGTDSTHSSESEVVFNRKTNRIMDIYDWWDSYDIFVRGENVDIKTGAQPLDRERLKEKQQEFIKAVDQEYIRERSGNTES